MNNSHPISSLKNPKFIYWQHLIKSHHLKTDPHFFLFGRKVVNETLSQHLGACESLLLSPAHHQEFKALRKWGTLVNCYELSPPLFNLLDIWGTRYPLLICKTPAIKDWDDQVEPKGLEIICSLGDPSNVGAIARSSCAFECPRMILLKESASPFHPKSVRAASGALLKLQFARGPSMDQLQTSRSAKSTTFCLDLTGQNIRDLDWPRNARLIVGQEGLGVGEIPNVTKVRIPISSSIDSLNAAAAVSVALFSYRSQFALFRDREGT